MIVFPNCKINLGLHILCKRTDGYHDLETIFYPLPLYDVLETIRQKDGNPDEPSIMFSNSGFSINGQAKDNLCVKAYHLLKDDFPQLPPVSIHLHKTIPIGAGLGGGSADAAFTLLLLNKQFQLNLSTRKLVHYSLQLGSDCPFFIVNKPCFATGRGESLDPITIDLSAYKFVIVNPGIHVNTTTAFSGITPALRGKSVKEIIQQPLEKWKNELINDFEKPVSMQHPEIGSIKTKLYNGGAIYASMSGSGSTVYGIFKKDDVPQFNFPSNYLVKEIPAA
ncbi:MAG: 4-(cytidine 5'-diphospho)-2-C-methyl-D-erythritol kinase [Chitinophagaceae bacterium]